MFPAIREFLKEFFARVLKKKKEEPPSDITAKPVRVRNIWEKNSRRINSLAVSFGIHAFAFVMLFFVFGGPVVVEVVTKEIIALISPVEPLPLPAIGPEEEGGGGGEKLPLPPSKGRAPKPALRQFVPPSAVPPARAKLVVEPTLILPPDIQLPGADLPRYGDPFAKFAPPSSGPGSGGGIGTGKGGGVGPGRGPGVGPGEGGGIGGGVFRAGGGVSAPTLIYKIEPEYSEEARKVKFQGMVVLSVIVDTGGTVKNIKVIRSLGLGLDEKAVEAIKKWRFRPGMKNGKAVAVHVTIEVNFRLL